jgi:uncharacterized membrane protein
MSAPGDDSSDAQVARLPLRVRTAADLEALKANARALRKLPRAGLEVRIPDLDPLQSRRLERRIRVYIRSCGCAEGAAAALIVAILAIGFIAFQAWTRGPQWSDIVWVAVGLFLAVVAGGLGKLLGVAIARLRFEQCCRRVIGSLDVEPVARSGRTVP